MENNKNSPYERKMQKEYCIFVQNGCCPQYEATVHFQNFQQAYLRMLDMVEQERKRNRPYFVDNKDYQNEYTKAIIGKTFTIKLREYTEWQPIDSINDIREQEKPKNAKILKFLNYK